jgi:hypothetical protein
MKTTKRLVIASAGWVLLGLVVLFYKGPYARGTALFTVWSLYAFAAGIWVVLPLLKIVSAAMGKEKSRGSTHPDES